MGSAFTNQIHSCLSTSVSQSANDRHLFYCGVVAREGGMARAAERRDIAVSTISAPVRVPQMSLAVPLAQTHGLVPVGTTPDVQKQLHRRWQRPRGDAPVADQAAGYGAERNAIY